MNYVRLGFCLTSTSMLFCVNLLRFFEKKLPKFVGESFRYGKNSSIEKSKYAPRVPKSWFKHFYVIALSCYFFTFMLATIVYILNRPVPLWFIHLLRATCGEERTSFVSSTQAYLGVCLMTLHVSRRFYETHFVSIFSKSSSMNLHQYIIGLFYYPGTALAIISEAPTFSQTSLHTSENINVSSLTYFEIVAIVLFLWAWWHQYACASILANLRKNKKGEVVTEAHKLPYGDWFEYISSPLEAAEIIMYTSVTVILRNNVTWYFVYLLVLVNQFENMLLNHRWYQETFKDLPSKRKAVIPFIY